MTTVHLKLKDGGPAFPRPFSFDESPHSGVRGGDRVTGYPDQDGMSLRDYFAAAALPQCQVDTHRGKDDPLSWEELVAQATYKIADAMLKERSK